MKQAGAFGCAVFVIGFAFFGTAVLAGVWVAIFLDVVERWP